MEGLGPLPPPQKKRRGGLPVSAGRGRAARGGRT